MIFRKIYKKLEKNMIFWWEPKDGAPNVGDYLAYLIVNKSLELNDLSILDKKSSKNKLFSIGSVLHFSKNNDCVWGTGLNKKVPDELHKFKSLDVRAVRGPKTRDYLLEKGIECPAVFGDPGLLTSLFYPSNLFELNEVKSDFVIIPHMNDDMSIYDDYKKYLCSPRQYPMAFVKGFLNTKLVVSSSLHGIIMAESYGIPAIYLDSESGESKFKYDDYYFGTERFSYPIATSIEEAIKTVPATLPNVEKINRGLLNSFPYDLWHI